MDPAAVATLVIAVLGLALSVASLTWQAATFILSGSRVRAELRHGARNADVVAVGPLGSQRLSVLAAQGLTEEVIGIEVRNVGRLAASVDSVEAALEGGMKFAMLQSTIGPPLSHRLEPQSSASWSMPAAPIRAAVGASAEVLKRPNPCKVWMEVTVAGKVVRSRQSMRLGSRAELDR
jgi:hypothetical protein